MDKNKRRMVMLVACCLINLCLGSIYSWSVFAQAMATYLNQSARASLNPGDLAIVYTVANCVGPITMIAGGRINDKYGPRLVIMAGGVLFGVGMIASGFAKSVGFLVVSFGIVGGLGLGMAYGSVISTAVKLFPDKSGLMGGLTTAAYGISSIIVPPLVSAIVSATSAPFAFQLMGGVFLVTIAVASLFLDVSLLGEAPVAGTARRGKDVVWQDMVRMPVFYVMLTLLICGAFSGMMVISQASAIATSEMGMAMAQAATVVSVLALFNTLGRIGTGTLSDRIGRVGALRLACVVAIVAQTCLFFAGKGGVVLFFAGVVLVGLSFGSFMGVYPGFTADRFGIRNNSVNYGIMCIGFALAGFFGPLIAQTVFNTSGSYANAFVFAGAFSACGLALTFVYQRIGGLPQGMVRKFRRKES